MIRTINLPGKHYIWGVKGENEATMLRFRLSPREAEGALTVIIQRSDDCVFAETPDLSEGFAQLLLTADMTAAGGKIYAQTVCADGDDVVIGPRYEGMLLEGISVSDSAEPVTPGEIVYNSDRITRRLTGESVGDIVSSASGEICAYSFYRHPGSFTVTANSASQINEYAFAQSGITALTAAAVTQTEGYICDGCGDLTSVSLSSLTALGNRSFQDCSALAEVYLPSVTSIGQYAFKGCASLTAAPFREGLTEIQQYAFQDSGLQGEVVIPDTVTALGVWVFYRCTGITGAVIGTGVTQIGTNLFNGCSALERVTLCGSVTRIGANAFLNCSSLGEIVIRSSSPPTLDNVNAFSGIASDYRIYVPAESLSAYRGASRWSTVASHIFAISEG